MKFKIGGSQVVVNPRSAIGKGMEADVYNLGGTALKVFKGPNHPDLLNDVDREAARRKIEEHQQKLSAFPKNLPPHVVSPVMLAFDSSDKVAGYTMKLVDNPTQFKVFGQVADRLNGIDSNRIVACFSDLRATVDGLHKSGVVIGDFNDLNVLASGNDAYVIDADSFQFGPFQCRMFTEEFVDPRLCDPNGKSPVLGRPHDPTSDWYAFAVMFFKSLLCVGPFGGIYKPVNSKSKLLHTQRPLAGVSVFNPEVVYPRKAIPFKVLPDEALDFFEKAFEKRARDEFPAKIVASIVWKKCSSCGVEHARVSCPNCKVAPPLAAVKEHIEVHGRIKSTTVFQTRGKVVYATVQDDRLAFLYSEGDKFYREDRTSICNGRPDHGMRFRICKDTTVIGKGSSVYVLSKTTNPAQIDAGLYQGKQAVFDASSAGLFWEKGGFLLRGNSLGLSYNADPVGQVLEGQTAFWVGDEFGLGFYRAGEIFVSFLFGAKHKWLNDGVSMPKIEGQLLGATCCFSSARAALLVSFKNGPTVVNRCVLVKSSGEVVGVAEAVEGDGSWLSSIHGKCVVGDGLLSPTDNGIIRVDFQNGALSRETLFEGSESFVDSASRLFAVKDGIYCVDDDKVSLLQVQK